MRDPRPRGREAGVTLVEMLVVVALIATVAGAAALSLRPGPRGDGAEAEARLLAARMRRASEEAVLTGAPVALLWDEASYRFVALAEGAWAPHPLPLLAEPRALPGALRLDGAPGAFIVTADALPARGEALRLRIGEDAEVLWDGAGARP